MGLLLASPSPGAQWLKGGQVTGRDIYSVSAGGSVSYIPTGVADDSPVLSVAGCDSFDLLYYNNTDGDATVGTVTVTVRSCPTTRATDRVTEGDTIPALACWAIENIVLDGIASTNTEAIYAAGAQWIFAETGGIENDDDTQELIVRCNGPAR